ncbi:MAG: Fic family protein [Gemmatimonadetes bacterium]|nr:Fic family protein [Gemmatimonadota bacterium]
MSFRSGRLAKLSLPAGTVWLLTDIAEAKGKQELYAKQAPQVLKALRETALVQSVESSNRIEGVTVPAARLRPLVVGRARPRDRSEGEIQGYRRALELIHTQARDLPVTLDVLRRLHRIAQYGAADAGEWKQIENEIIEHRQGAPPVVRFRPASVAETPGAVDELCLCYRHGLAQEPTPPLVAIAALVLDFLCIHPFRDGIGQVKTPRGAKTALIEAAIQEFPGEFTLADRAGCRYAARRRAPGAGIAPRGRAEGGRGGARARHGGDVDTGRVSSPGGEASAGASPAGDAREEEWSAGDEIRISETPAALARSLGNFPFWQGERPLIVALEEIYRNASRLGMAALLGLPDGEETGTPDPPVAPEAR